MKITPPTSNPPSRKRTRVVIAALVLICVVGLASLYRPAPEPGYNGKPFSQWLEEYSRQRGLSEPRNDQAEALNALGKMGEKAVPIIIRTLEKNNSPMRNNYRKFWLKMPAFLKGILPTPKPQLFSVDDARWALQHYAGTNIAAQLSLLLRSGNPAVREVAFENLEWNSFPLPEVISICTSGLKDSNENVRLHSTLILGAIGPAASNAVPALVNSLQSKQDGSKKKATVHINATTVAALGRIGPAAASSVPALTNLLTSTDAYLRVQAASAIWHITSNENIPLPVMISDIPNLNRHEKWNAFVPLKEMGPRAKIAIPMLLNELKNANNYDSTLASITNALKSIDPEAAAKAGVK